MPWPGSILVAVLALVADAATALELKVPGNAKLTNEVVTSPDSYLLPVDAFADGDLPVVKVEGRVLQQAWKIEQSGMTSLQTVRPMQDQLESAGYTILLNCGGQTCGGFDFRFGTRVMEPPYMYVDIFDFHFLSARKDGTAGDDFISVLASRTGSASYVQIIQATSDQRSANVQTRPEVNKTSSPADDTRSVANLLVAQGHVILRDLEFESGSASLGQGSYPSLQALAAFLLADENRRIALVGHTDMVGALDRNIALSRQRAQSVLARLVGEYGVPRVQLDAEGVGYLSPIAPNRTPGDREVNRRVEAVLVAEE